METQDVHLGDAKIQCPEGCGFCERHEQHLCMPIVEITTRCDLACPVCINASGRNSEGTSPQRDLSLHEFRHLLDVILEAEGQIDVLNLSGGEPLLHPQLLEMIDEALSRKEIVRVSLSTNGLRFLDEPSLLKELHKRHIVISLQFDGFHEKHLSKTFAENQFFGRNLRSLTCLKMPDNHIADHDRCRRGQ